ncbi:MAG: hypothetical protein CME70_17365 [Halobacteriovorax sp.]|nr:hypothetical protein [Halobacteriovorax sp.]|tara:strand:+ start:58534 stop:59730 length:1197 start_codon:yes stop_codon:yes gene_type:complete
MKNITVTLLIGFSLLLSSCVEEQETNCGGDSVNNDSKECSTAETDQREEVEEDEDSTVAQPIPSSETDVFEEVATYFGRWVDDSESMNELLSLRDNSVETVADSCHDDFENQDRFSDTMAFFIREQSAPRKVTIQSIASYYGTSSDLNTHNEVGLFSHPLCEVSNSSLRKTVKKVPDSGTISKANSFAKLHNQYRVGYLNGDSQEKLKLERHWGAFFGCLAYAESLSTADSSSSKSVASSVAPSGYRKPAGVKFYNDKYQPPSSRLNIGLYQFTPKYSGNINPCIKQWNSDYPTCSTSARSQGDLIKLLGSSHQRFNAFCGVNKLLQTFSIQVNTSSSKHTHPGNRNSSGLKPGANRCVTPHFYAGWAYNHFGPLQNSTGSNMKKLFSCINDSLPDGL